eukprot:TRINITY_DN21769_c0_g2_i1.p1 TRINITY_DN21769_c0_g2~~TRINITY_DN21769_c0_g2_i1.p1  ORF type:complete len:450 (+),score=42.74 TRINITY_DN21769_c0_g2_i1:133-1350(+)
MDGECREGGGESEGMVLAESDPCPGADEGADRHSPDPPIREPSSHLPAGPRGSEREAPNDEREAELKGSLVARVPSLLLRRHNHQHQVAGFRKHGGCCRRCVSSLERWYVTSWWAQFLCGTMTILAMLVDPVLDYCTIYLYASHGKYLWVSLGVLFVLLSPWLSLWLHLRASRADLVKPHKRVWLKALVVPLYEGTVGWRAVRFMWQVRKQPRLYPAIEVAMAEVLILAGQEALFESLPQLIIQGCAYWRDYYGSATDTQNALFLVSMGTSACVIASRIVSTLLFVHDGGFAAFAFLSRVSTADMQQMFVSASPFAAAREAERVGNRHKGFGADLWLALEQQMREATESGIYSSTSPQRQRSGVSGSPDCFPHTQTPSTPHSTPDVAAIDAVPVIVHESEDGVQV